MKRNTKFFIIISFLIASLVGCLDNSLYPNDPYGYPSQGAGYGQSGGYGNPPPPPPAYGYGNNYGGYNPGYANGYNYDYNAPPYRNPRDRNPNGYQYHQHNHLPPPTVVAAPPPVVAAPPVEVQAVRPSCPAGTRYDGKSCLITDDSLRRKGGDGRINPCPKGMWVSGDVCVGN